MPALSHGMVAIRFQECTPFKPCDNSVTFDDPTSELNSHVAKFFTKIQEQKT